MPADVHPPDTLPTRHISALGAWELVTRPPHPGLQPYATAYMGYVETAAARAIRRREVPWPGVVLIVNFGPAFRIGDPRTAAPADYHSFVAGLHDSYVVTESTGPSYCMQINLTPIGAYLLFGVPMDKIANRTVDLEDLLGAGAGRLSDRLQAAPTWNDRFSLVDGFIRDRVAHARGAAPQIMWAWRRLQHPDGARRIGAIAEEVGWSSKRLIAGFREQIGLPPKALARIIRFNRVVRWLDDLEEVRWAELAHRAGYFDQAHFNRDFRELAGGPPGDFLRRRQAGEGGVLED